LTGSKSAPTDADFNKALDGLTPQKIKDLALPSAQKIRSLEVSGALGDLTTLERNVLDNTLLVVHAGNTNPSRVTGQSSFERPIKAPLLTTKYHPIPNRPSKISFRTAKLVNEHIT
jgi:hypothetical protein